MAPSVGHSGKGFSVTFDNVLRIKQFSPGSFLYQELQLIACS